MMKTAKYLQLEGNRTKYLLNRLSLLPEEFDCLDVDTLKLHMLHEPIEINVCRMFPLNYFILYSVEVHTKFEVHF
jgi:hypothetical protein